MNTAQIMRERIYIQFKGPLDFHFASLCRNNNLIMDKRPRTSKGLTPKVDTELPKIPPPLSLQAYVSNLFYVVVLQDDHEIFESTYDKNWSRDVTEV